MSFRRMGEDDLMSRTSIRRGSAFIWKEISLFCKKWRSNFLCKKKSKLPTTSKEDYQIFLELRNLVEEELHVFHYNTFKSWMRRVIVRLWDQYIKVSKQNPPDLPFPCYLWEELEFSYEMKKICRTSLKYYLFKTSKSFSRYPIILWDDFQVFHEKTLRGF